MRKVNKKGILNIILLASVFFYIFFAYKNEMIPFKYQLFAFAFVFLLFLIAILVRRSFIKIMILVLIVMVSFLHIKAQDMLGQMFITENEESRRKQATVSMVTLVENLDTDNFYKESRYATTNDLDIDFHQYIYTDISNEYDIVPNMKTINSNVDAANALFSDEIDIMILDESQRDKLLEDFPGFNDRTKVLKTFEKEIIIESNAIKVNPQEESFVLLLTANDTFGDLDTESLADVNILAVVNPKIDQVVLVSIPRDTYVPLACKNGEYDKLTHTGFYGIDCQIDTISDLIEVDINYYARVNFSSMMNIIDIIGGNVNIYNPYAFQGHTEEYYFEEGCLSLNKYEVMNYVRTRYELPDGDFGRQENQKRVINSLVKKMTNPSRLLNMGSLFTELSQQVDTNIDVQFVNRFLSHQIDKLPNFGWTLNSLTIEGYDDMRETFSFPYQELYVFQPNIDQLETVTDNLKEFMKAKNLSEVAFLNPDPVTPEIDPIDVEAPTVTNEPTVTEPIAPEVREIYEPIVHENIFKYGILIEPFELKGQKNFTKLEYIQACEATFSH